MKHNYKEFKKMLGTMSKVDEKEYNLLVEYFGDDLVKQYFDKYISDPKVKNTKEKEAKINYYVSLQVSQEEKDEDLDLDLDDLYADDGYKMDDPVQMYLRTIGDIPLLTPEEEIELATNLAESRKSLEAKCISVENINNFISELTTKINDENRDFKSLDNEKVLSDNSMNGLQNKIVYLQSIREEYFNIQDVSMVTVIDEVISCINTYSVHRRLLDKFINSNLKLVVSIAKRYVGNGLTFLDLIEDGNIGLQIAVERFDVTKGFKFSTYATWWIRQQITRGLADKGRTIRIPVHLTEKLHRYLKFKEEIGNGLQSTPTSKDVITYCKKEAKEKLQKAGRENITEELIQAHMIFNTDEIYFLEKCLLEPVSLNTPVGDEEDNELGDFLEASNVNVEQSGMLAALQGDLKDVILGDKSDFSTVDCKDIRQFVIICARNGVPINNYLDLVNFKRAFTGGDDEVLEAAYVDFSSGNCFTLEEIGQVFGVTRERIRQIESKAMKKYKTRGQKKGLDQYLAK